MVKRFAALWAALLMMVPVFAGADMEWKLETDGQKLLKEYTEHVNQLLMQAGEMPVNSLFEIYPGFAVMGITQEADAETPEDIEITVDLSQQTILSLELRVCDLDRFPTIAGCLILALYGDGITEEEAFRIPLDRVQQAKAAPTNSFEEPVEKLNGTIPRFYYAYYPNPYHDGNNWIQMTMVFPMEGTWDGNGMIVGEEGNGEGTGMLPEEEADPDYEGYYASDDYEHLEIFTTPTPEPDSAAAEYDFR